MLIVIAQLPINSGGSTWPWNSAMVISMLCIGAISWFLFFIVQKRLARIPIIPLHLFTQRSTLILFLQAPAYDFVWQVDLYFLPLYFQDVRGYTALQTATLLLPLLVTLSVAGAVSGPLMTKFARYVSSCRDPVRFGTDFLCRYGPVLWIGFAFWLLGVGLKVNFSRTAPVWAEVLTLIVEGIGIGFVHQPGGSHMQ
jgi:hypothetical protein